MDIVETWDVVGGFALALFGFIVGRRERNTRRPKPPSYTCGCGHHYAMHDESGKCKKLSGIDNDRKCGCQRYVGTVPVELTY